MTKSDPIIAVNDVEASSKWYQSVFGCRSRHGGMEFDVLVDENNEVLICLHKWGEHEHPTMLDATITHGNGVILYFRTDKMKEVRQNLEEMGAVVDKEIHLNQNSNRAEFTITDPDGYYLIISDFHTYEG